MRTVTSGYLVTNASPLCCAQRPADGEWCVESGSHKEPRSRTRGLPPGGEAGRMAPRATFRDVFAVREFRALWTSVILSAAGDRLALVAIAVLVYDRTRSPLLAALAYAAGYL